MLKKIGLNIFFTVLGCASLFAQNKVKSTDGTVTFEASVHSFEEVKATATNPNAILNLDDGKLAVLINVTTFTFKNSLMQEHFNENYIESSKYPKASFTGSIIGFNSEAISNEPIKYALEGDLSLHGKTKHVKSSISVSRVNSIVNLKTNFKVTANDYDIEIPSLITKKIAENITIEADLGLQ